MTFSIKDLQSYLPFFIEEYKPKNPKGQTKGRGEAVVAICEFLLWIDKNIKEINANTDKPKT